MYIYVVTFVSIRLYHYYKNVVVILLTLTTTGFDYKRTNS